MKTTALTGARVHHRGNLGSDPRDGTIVEVDEGRGMIRVEWSDGRTSWELSALLGLPSGLQFVKAAKEVAPGDQVVERGGAVLEVAQVERTGKSVLVHFARYGSTALNPLRVKASAMVYVARPAWLS